MGIKLRPQIVSSPPPHRGLRARAGGAAHCSPASLALPPAYLSLPAPPCALPAHQFPPPPTLPPTPNLLQVDVLFHLFAKDPANPDAELNVQYMYEVMNRHYTTGLNVA